MTLGEVVRQVRREVPTAAEITVKLYLNTLHYSDRFEKTAGHRFKLSQSYLDHLNHEPRTGPTGRKDHTVAPKAVKR